MPTPSVCLLPLVLLLLFGEPSGARGYLRSPRAPFLVPQGIPLERTNGQLRSHSGSSSSCSGKSINSSKSSGAADLECPRCAWLRTSEETSPLVVGGEKILGVSVFEDVRHKLPSESAVADATGAAGSPVAVAPTTDAAPSAVDVVPVEVAIAPETRRALGLFRGSQKRHIFLPLCLLGLFNDQRGADAPHGGGNRAGGSWEGQGMMSTSKPLQAQRTQLPSLAETDGSPPQSFLEALKQAACKALKLRGGFGWGIPLQLVAQISAPRTKSRFSLQPDSAEGSQLDAIHLPSHNGLESVGRPLPVLLPLASEEDAIRILREHYGPLFAQYQRLPHCPACFLPSSMGSDGSNRKDGFVRSAALRILRLPRGPRLSLHLQLEPPLPSVPFPASYAMHDLAGPPLLRVTKTHEVDKPSTSDVSSPYQLVSLYKFFSVKSPQVLAELLKALWAPKGVLGRAYVATEGLNAQLAVPSGAMSDLLGELQQIPGLEDGMQVTLDCLVTFEEFWDSPPFDTLHIRARHQVLRDGFTAPLDWGDCGVEVNPNVWHRKLTDMLQQQQQQQQPLRKMVLLDMRNADEYAVGHFKGAMCIDTPTFADSFVPGGPLEKALIQAGVHLPSQNSRLPSLSSSCSSAEDVEVLMYCTGGIRCVKAGAFLRQVLGFPRVTRLKGGILAYKNYIQGFKRASTKASRCNSFATEEKMLSTGVFDSGKDESCFCDTVATLRQPRTAADGADADSEEIHAGAPKSLFLGSNYVFDHRMCQPITPDLLAQCSLCGGPSGRLSNCSNRRCGRRFVLCSSCCTSLGEYCSSACAQHGEEDSERDTHARIQRRMQARHTHKRLIEQRGLWAIRAQQLLAALKHNAAFGPPVVSVPSVESLAMRKTSQRVGRIAAEGTGTKDLWKWAHEVATADSSPSALQEPLLEEGRNTARSLVGATKGSHQFWSGRLHSRILSTISRLRKPSSILEIGAFVGISSGTPFTLPRVYWSYTLFSSLRVHMCGLPLSSFSATLFLCALSLFGRECAFFFLYPNFHILGQLLLVIVSPLPMLFICPIHAALALAEGLACDTRVPNTCVGLVSIEKDPRAAAAARRLVSSSLWSHLITVVEADALHWLRSQPTSSRHISSRQATSEDNGLVNVSPQGKMIPDGGFDLIYLDAEKRKYAEYIARILDPERPLLAPDGALLIDNTLWNSGQDGKRPSWWEDEAARDDAPRTKRYARIAESIKAVRETLRNDPRISHVLLPVGDGLSIVTWATPASGALH